MRLISWILTISFVLAGLALRADHGWPGLSDPRLVEAVSKGFFILAWLACPALWASYGLVPRALRVPAKQRMMMALALVLAAPLVLPWP